MDQLLENIVQVLETRGHSSYDTTGWNKLRLHVRIHRLQINHECHDNYTVRTVSKCIINPIRKSAVAKTC